MQAQTSFPCACGPGEFVGNSPPILGVLRSIERLAKSDVDVLVLGETGTGKELVARAIHQESHRSGGPFVAAVTREGRETSSEWKFETMPFSEIAKPGAYYLHSTGALCRLPAEALRPGHSPVLDIVQVGDNRATRLSDDPYVALSKARILAADADLQVNF